LQDLVEVPRQSANLIGFIVAFGTKRTNNPADLRTVTFGPNTIDDNTFEMFVLEPIAGSTPGLEVWAKVPKEMTELIPLRIDALTTAGRVAQATEIPIPAGVTSVPCTGAGVMWNRELFGILKGRRLMIQIKGDFIPDALDNARPRAVDANFLLGTLPTGDGVAGGTFWSWVTLR
jgi:hypothetical protein